MPRPDFPKTLAEFLGAGMRGPIRWRVGAVAVRACREQVSVTAGTVMHRTRLPLRDRVWAAYLVTTHTPGFSAWQLQRKLGLGRYETAWAMLQKLRRAMIRSRARLHRRHRGRMRPMSARYPRLRCSSPRAGHGRLHESG